MLARSLTLGALLVAAAAMGHALGQEGHPLRGSWIGVWEGNEAHGDDVVVVLEWDGQAISGMINPGTDNIAIDTATLDPEDWSVHIEADAQGPSGRRLNYVIDATIQELELPTRQLVGTWRSEAGRGVFEIRRQ